MPAAVSTFYPDRLGTGSSLAVFSRVSPRVRTAGTDVSHPELNANTLSEFN